MKRTGLARRLEALEERVSTSPQSLRIVIRSVKPGGEYQDFQVVNGQICPIGTGGTE